MSPRAKTGSDPGRSASPRCPAPMHSTSMSLSSALASQLAPNKAFHLSPTSSSKVEHCRNEAFQHGLVRCEAAMLGHRRLCNWHGNASLVYYEAIRFTSLSELCMARTRLHAHHGQRADERADAQVDEDAGVAVRGRHVPNQVHYRRRHQQAVQHKRCASSKHR